MEVVKAFLLILFTVLNRLNVSIYNGCFPHLTISQEKSISCQFEKSLYHVFLQLFFSHIGIRLHAYTLKFA